MKRPIAEVRTRLAELLDLMEKAEENGASREQVVILGAFADGMAFALGEDMEEDYFELARRLAGQQEEEKPVSTTWKMV